ncbi:MAG: DnaA regulatory inactivator Hda [Cellvibrionaceae bacterium]|nr:DnaA regulatory inactivator Hda [Cellvibrionaceae bacterium]
MSTDTPIQLSLGVSLRDDRTFKNFYSADGVNQQVLSAIKGLAEGVNDNLIIWGRRGSGLTHLLQAACHDASNNAFSIQYLPLHDMLGYAAEDVCDGLAHVDLVCIDGIDSICGNRQWERAVFNLFNDIRDAGNCLLFASHTSPPALPILLADLKSRLLSCTVYHVEKLSDDDKRVAMIKRAAARGMEMPQDVARFILNRACRDTSTLFELLDCLDDASLQKQRKLTIPFVKEVLGEKNQGLSHSGDELLV